MPAEISLREHLEMLWVEREKRIDEQLHDLSVSIERIGLDVRLISAEVTTLKVTAQARQALRGMDYTRVTVLASALTVILSLLMH